MAKKTSSKKTMDITKPGESAPSTTSRPVIITHRPIVKDPMMKAAKYDNGLDKSESSLSAAASSSGKTIVPPTGIKILSDKKPDADSETISDEEVKTTKPTSQETDDQAEEVETDDSKTDVSPSKTETKDTISAEPEQEPKTKTDKDTKETEAEEPPAEMEKPEQEPTAQDSIGSEEVEPTTEDEQTMVKKKQEDLENQAEKKRHELIDKLVADKTYFLPIGKVTRQRGNKQAFTILILIILLAVAGLYGAVKVGLINLPFKLPF